MNYSRQQCELYPQKRPTEFYRTPEPRICVQSHKAEHPNVRSEAPVRQLAHIVPARTSGMRIQRNSYFS